MGLAPSYLDDTTRYLLTGAKAASTIDNYEKAWANYVGFLLDYDLVHSEQALCRYIGNLFDNNYQGSTITSRFSAISYACGLQGLPDYAKSILIQELLKGARACTHSKDSRKPIREAMLVNIMRAIFWVVPTAKRQALYKCVFLWAFFATLRVSEYMESPLADHNLRFENIKRIFEVDDIVYKLRFTSYKSSDIGTLSTYTLGPDISHEICPVKLMDRYLAFRGSAPGPLFLLSGRPLKGTDVTNVLHMALRFMQVDATFYAPHSFRIRRCTQWAEEGMTEADIRHKGRWNSNAYLRYIHMADIVLL